MVPMDHIRITRIAPWVAGMSLAMLLATSCGPSGQERQNKPAVVQALDDPVRYVRVVEREIPDTLELAAKIQPDPTRVERIFPPASGRILAIEVKPADRVRRGQTLAILASSDVAGARSDFARARIEADRATRAMQRQKSLFDHGAAAEKDFLEASAQADAAHAELARARQRLELLGVSPSATSDQVRLAAPADGVVLDVSAAPGEFSKSLESANPLISIADLSTVWAIGDVYEKDIAKVVRGKPVIVTLQAYPETQWIGRLDSLSGALDPVTRTLKVRVALPNRDERLKPEMFATIRVSAGKHSALLVPALAILREGNTTAVFLKTASGVEQRTVTVGQALGSEVEILSGLRPGDEVAADGAELLKGGPGE